MSVFAAMIILSDNDILLKMAAFDLLEAAFSLFESNEVYVLTSAPFSIRSPKTARSNAPEAIERAAAFADACPKLRATPHAQDNDAFVDVEGIDAGEAILFSAMRDFDDAVLVTGDKRCLKALARCENGAAMRELLRGKVVCLEEIVRCLIANRGFEFIKNCIVPQRDCDKVMLVAFSLGHDTQKASALNALKMYIEDLEKTVGENWLWRP